MFTLLNNTNLLRWEKVDSALYSLCKTNNQTQIHILNNCPAAVRSGRYSWLHNSILYTCHYLSEFENAGFKLYADLIGFKSPMQLFNRLIPDIVLAQNDKLIVIELTCCFETNFAKSRQYRINRYENIKKDYKNSKWTVAKIFVAKVSSLGSVTKNVNRF